MNFAGFLLSKETPRRPVASLAGHRAAGAGSAVRDGWHSPNFNYSTRALNGGRVLFVYTSNQ